MTSTAKRSWSNSSRIVLACAAAVALVVAALAFTASPAKAYADDGVPMYRLYNPYTGEHFYTASADECDNVVVAGWIYEGVGWVAPSSGEPVYRLYNEFGGEHHYTPDATERASLLAAGWSDEGESWYSGGSVPLYREYNPNMSSCNHNYTTNATEHGNLVGIGWSDEGVAWYGEAEGYIVPEDAESAWVGRWNLVDAHADETVNGISLDRNTLLMFSAMGYYVYVDLAADGSLTGFVSGGGETYSYSDSTWAAKDATTGYVFASYEDSSGWARLTLADGKLTISSDGGWAVLEKIK